MSAVWKYDSAIRKRRKVLTPMCVQREGDRRGWESATVRATNKRASLKRLIFCTGTAHAEFKSWEW